MQVSRLCSVRFTFEKMDIARQIMGTLHSHKPLSQNKELKIAGPYTLELDFSSGIGYTDIYPVERLLRDVRLITIWTGTNEIMDLVIQSEFYKEFLAETPRGRDVEADAEGAELPDEKIYNLPEEST